jgi:hypothetical protein
MLLAISMIIWILPNRTVAQDPDSLLTEWLSASEWMDIAAYPDIAADWLADLDTLSGDRDTSGIPVVHLLTVSLPAGACLFDWRRDSGNFVSPVSMKYRIRIRGGRRWECRIQTNHPAGDTCFLPPREGFPKSLSAGLLVRPGSLVREVIVGDYQMSVGFGVVAGSSPVFGTALGDPSPLARTGTGMRLHSGNTSAPFLRGMAALIPTGKSELTLFGSGRSTTGAGAAGVAWKRTFASFEAGLTMAGSGNQDPPQVKKDWNDNLQPDSGRFIRAGIWGRIRTPFGLFFSELGWSPSGGYAWTGGIRLFDVHGFSAVLKAAGCSAAYPVPFSIFQSGSGQIREGRKMIAAFRYALGSRVEWTGSGEVNRSTWPGGTRFGDATTRMIHQFRYTAREHWRLIGSIQLDFKEKAGRQPQKLLWKLSFDSDPERSGAIRLRSGIRGQMQGFGSSLHFGTTADCSLCLALAGKAILLTSGFRLFSTDSGTDPLYAYEPDVRYGFSAPVLSGSGSRFYITGRCKLLNFIDLEIKVSRSAYTDLKHVSDGNDGGWSGKVQVGFREGGH